MRGKGGGGGVRGHTELVKLFTGPQKNFGDHTPYLPYAFRVYFVVLILFYDRIWRNIELNSFINYGC